MQTSESRLSIADTFSNPVRWLKMRLTTAQVLVAYVYSALAMYSAMYSHDFTLMFLGIFVIFALALTHYQIGRAEKKKLEMETLQFK